jgi:hypothetical protein
MAFWRFHAARKKRHDEYQSVRYGCHNQDQGIYLKAEQRALQPESGLWIRTVDVDSKFSRVKDALAQWRARI